MRDVDWHKAQKIFQNDKENISKILNKKLDRYPYSREVLTLLAAGVVFSGALVMPGLGKVFGTDAWKGKEYKKKRLTQTLKRFEKQKIVEVVEGKEGYVVRITRKGFTKALKYKLDELKVDKQKKWDKKWRVVIFDIPEQKRKIRDEFRKILRQMDFHPLQESVYVHAYPCFDQVEFLRQIFDVNIDVTYIVAQKIEGQDNLRGIFKV